MDEKSEYTCPQCGVVVDLSILPAKHLCNNHLVLFNAKVGGIAS